MDWRRRRLEGYGGLWIRAVGGERGGVDWEASGEGGWIRLPAADVARECTHRRKLSSLATLALIFHGSIRSRRSPSMTFVVPRIEETAGAPRKALSADFYFEAVLKSPKITKFGTVAEG